MNQPGLNIIGDLTAQRGLTEAARSTILSMQHSGIPLSYFEDAYDGFPPDQRDDQIGLTFDWQGHAYAVNLLFHGIVNFQRLNDQQLMRLTASKYTIAYWVWEFPTLPELLQDQLQRVDEIWTASAFSQACLSQFTDKPVNVIPHPMPAKGVCAPDRAAFALPEDRFMFLFVFDATSSIARKNPHAVITAFERAFGCCQANGPILVMKARHMNAHPALESELRSRLERVGGVLLTDNHSRQDTDRLLACADAYISLHRAEGFGLTMAEAMTMGKPVIATGYSGNMDYMTPANSYLVDYTLRKVNASDHLAQPWFDPLYLDRDWAEPDLDQAAAYMDHVVNCPDEATNRGACAAISVQQVCSAEVVGRLAKTRLEEIHNIPRLSW